MSATVTHLRVANPRHAPPPVLPMHVGAYVHSILEAATALMRMGHEVMAFQADVVSAYPVLWLKDSPALRNMTRCGQASYDRTGTGDSGPYRIGVFLLHGVTVQWLEWTPS